MKQKPLTPTLKSKFKRVYLKSSETPAYAKGGLIVFVPDPKEGAEGNDQVAVIARHENPVTELDVRKVKTAFFRLGYTWAEVPVDNNPEQRMFVIRRAQ